MVAGLCIVTRSANEVQNLIAKAARGAGAPAAQAAEFGRAAVFHLKAGRVEDDLWRAIEALPSGPIIALPLALTRLIEKAQDGQIAEGLLRCDPAPLLALSYAEALPMKNSAKAVETGASVSIETTVPAPRAAVERLTLSESFVAFLNDNLAKTLVPDTAASRAGGAGAGLSDND